MLTEKKIEETQQRNVANTSEKSSFSSTSSTPDIEFNIDVTKTQADNVLSSSASDNKTQVSNNVVMIKEAKENSETRIEQSIPNDNNTIIHNSSVNKFHPYIYFITYELPPLNSMPNSQTAHDMPIESKPVDIQTSLSTVNTQPKIDSPCLIPYSDYSVNSYTNFNYPHHQPQSFQLIPNNLQQNYVEEFQNTFFNQSSSSILFRRTNRVFFPLYCGTCKVYGCKCFYPHNDQYEVAQYTWQPNNSYSFQPNKVAQFSVEKAKSKQNGENHLNGTLEKCVENSMKKTVQLKRESCLFQKEMDECQYYQQKAPAPLHSIVDLNHNQYNNATNRRNSTNYHSAPIKQHKKKYSNFKHENQNKIDTYSILNEMNIVNKQKHNRKCDDTWFQEKSMVEHALGHFHHPNKAVQHGHGNTKGISGGKYLNQINYESHIKNKEFTYFQQSELNKSKQSNDFYQMGPQQSKSTNKNLPLCRLGPNCKFKRQNRCKFDHSKDAERSERSEKLVTNKNVFTNTFSLSSSVDQSTALNKFSQYYSIDSYLNNPSLIN